MTVAIVGPSSYIALRLRERLEDLGNKCILISLRRRGDKRYVNDNKILFNEELTEVDIKRYCISCVVICASLTAGECEEDPKRAEAVNTESVYRLVCKLARAGVQRFLYLSTIKVYGEELSGAITERTDVFPTTVYALTHYKTEQMMYELGRRQGLEVLTLRLSNVFGFPLERDSSAWSLATNSFAKEMATRGSISVKSPTVVRNLLPMSRLIEFIRLWVLDELDSKSDSIINVGSRLSLPMATIARVVQRVYEGLSVEDPCDILDGISECRLNFSVERMLKYMNSCRKTDDEIVIEELKRLCIKSKVLFGR